MVQSTYSFAVMTFLLSAAFACGQDVDDARSGALKFLKGLAAIRTVKLSGKIESAPSFESVVAIEIRGDAIWISRKGRFGQSEAEKTARDRTVKENREVMGTDGTSVEVYQDGKSYEFVPAMLELRISKSLEIHTNGYIKSIFPANWYGFHQFNHDALRFPSLLANKMTVGEVLDAGKVRFRNAEKTEGFSLREVVVDTTRGYTISRYEMSGGAIGNCIGEYTWEKDEVSGYWFPIHGKQTTEQGPIKLVTAEWTIDKISFDAKDIRSSFAFKESDFPFGTRIVDTSSSEREQHRYIGGEAGKREFDLRKATDRNFRLKRLP